MTSEDRPAPKKSARQIAISAALVTILAAGFGYLTLTLVRHALSPSADQALTQAEELPLIRLVVKENPAVDAQFRAAVEAEKKDPTREGPNRMFKVGAEVRKRYIVPALANTDDRHALAALRSLQEFIQYLQQTAPATCFEFGKIGLQRPDKLDSKGAALFKRVLDTQEEAYLDGKAATRPQPRPTSNDLSRALVEAGYTDADFRQLASYATLSDADGCAVTAKLYSAAALLPAERGALVARYLLTIAP